MVDVSENSKPWVVDEKALLRAVLRQSDLMDMALFITPDDFAAESHGVVWAVFQELRQRNGAITPLTVSQMIRRHMQDRPQDAERLATYVMRLQADSTEFTADEVRDLAENVGNYAAMRRSKDELRGLLALAEGNDQRFFAEWKRVGDDLSNRKRAERVETWSQLIDETLDELWQQHEGAGTPALPTGLPTLDFQEVVRKGEMVVVGGRPSTGKTALGIWMATWAAKAGHTALMVSLEMTGRRVVKRALSSYSGIPAGKLRRADFTVAEWDHIKDCAERQREWPLHTLYRGRIDYPTIVSEVRRLKAGGNLALLVVDYFQIIPKNVKRGMDATQTLAEMSGDFKRLAVQEDICVVLLSQLNRNHPGSDGGRARVEDLANTDALGRDADVVLLLSRGQGPRQESPPRMAGASRERPQGQAVRSQVQLRSGPRDLPGDDGGPGRSVRHLRPGDGKAARRSRPHDREDTPAAVPRMQLRHRADGRRPGARREGRAVPPTLAELDKTGAS
jgi:replicative DNA helicase